jgi:hypothetical protein
MSDLIESILAYIDIHGVLDTLEYSKENKHDHQKVIGSIKSIQTYEGVNQTKNCQNKYIDS